MIHRIRVAWDIDGTISLNPGPFPDWEDPEALTHTGEPIYGPMPEFRALNYLNPEMQAVNMDMIGRVVTGRVGTVEGRNQAWHELLGYGITIDPHMIQMFPENLRWTKGACLRNKSAQLNAATHYVDNDPRVCEILHEWADDLWTGSIDEFLALDLPGWKRA